MAISKKTESAIWFIVVGLIGCGASVFVLWFAFLGPLYLKPFREFLSIMLGMIVGIGLPSEIAASESMRPKLAIIFVGCFFSCAAAYVLPDLGHPSISYFLGPLGVLGFTASLLYSALSTIFSNVELEQRHPIQFE